MVSKVLSIPSLGTFCTATFCKDDNSQSLHEAIVVEWYNEVA